MQHRRLLNTLISESTTGSVRGARKPIRNNLHSGLIKSGYFVAPSRGVGTGKRIGRGRGGKFSPAVSNCITAAARRRRRLQLSVNCPGVVTRTRGAVGIIVYVCVACSAWIGWYSRAGVRRIYWHLSCVKLLWLNFNECVLTFSANYCPVLV